MEKGFVAPGLEIKTFGGVSILHDGAPVTGFVSRKVDALLIYLALNPREHSREVIGNMLWDDLPQERTLANLRMALSSLQQQLSPFILSTRHTIAINPQSQYWLDVQELDSTLNTADYHWKEHGSYSRAVVEQINHALKLYRGGFLEGFHLRDGRGFEGWKLLEHERLRFRVQETLYRLGSNALKQALYHEGIEYVTQLLAYDPLWEEAHRLLMLLYAYAGNRSAALLQYENCQRLLKDNLGVDPSDETFDLYCQIDDGVIKGVTQERVPHNIPLSPRAFVGRTEELQQILYQLTRPDCRLLTLIGLGGVGKTRLALAVAHQALVHFPDGVYFLLLGSITRPEFLIQAVADLLGLTFTTSDALTELTNHLRDRRILLILDSFEHLVDDAHVLSKLLSQTSSLKILLTTTVRLNLQEEWLVSIDGLPVPTEDSEAAQTNQSVQLFVETALHVKRDFQLESQLQDVIHICQLVEGLPLGVEIAASWVHMLSCRQIVEQIEADLSFLSTSLRNIPQRHRSLRALFEHTMNMLPEDIRMVLIRLSVFESSFTYHAAQKITGASLVALASLVEKSLLRVQDSGRYSLHGLLGRFAQSFLVDVSNLGLLIDRYIQYYVELAEEISHVEEDGRFSSEYGHFYKALNLAHLQHAAEPLLRLSYAMNTYWLKRGNLAEGRYWLSESLAMKSTSTSPKLRAQAFAALGSLAAQQRDYPFAKQQLQESLALYQQLDDQSGLKAVEQLLSEIV